MLMILVLMQPASAAVHDGTPPLLSFQGRLIRQDSTLYPDGTIELTVRFYDRDTGGVALITRTVTTTISNGIYNVILGDDIPLTEFDVNTSYWIEIQVPADAIPRRRYLINGARTSK